MVVEDEKAVPAETAHAQVQRILQSEEFRSSEVLRRLLTFLSDKALSGEADQLKEYSVAVDGLGKPPTYDPQHHSTVRIQMGRLRQRLAAYYRTEGKGDPLLVDLPKGRFRMVFEPRPLSPVEDAILFPPPADPSLHPPASPEASPG